MNRKTIKLKQLIRVIDLKYIEFGESMADPGFPGGALTLRVGRQSIILATFSQKLHEN